MVKWGKAEPYKYRKKERVIAMDRRSGILLPITALPTRYGIGTLGKEAYQFADFLREAGQKYWQLLPLGPTSYGDSPYQSFSSFAGNPYLIDLEQLRDDARRLVELAARQDSEELERLAIQIRDTAETLLKE